MADVSGKFFSAVKVRTGVSPSSPGVEVGETLPPVNPPGTSLNSVGLTMPSAFAVANSPLTSNGTIAVTGAGTVAQYVRGDGTLADFPESSGGGSSVSYYLNGSVSQGTIGGVAYLEMNKVPILGAGTDFTRNSNGYIASFITDAGDPNLLEIPGGNWNFESYFSASSGGGSPTFYVELYKVNAGGTATLIASNSANPELISFGTTIAPYFSYLAVPTTTLALTDRLAVRYYVTPAGRTLTLHTEGPHLCQIITTFTTGLTALNGLTAQVQFFAVGTSGTDFNIASATATHTFNLPTASATNRGALSSADWTTFNNKQNALTNPVTGTGSAGQVAYWSSGSAITGESNLFWDATNNRLGIGITPLYTLHIAQGNNLFLSNLFLAGTANNPILSSGATGGSMSLEGGGAGEGKIFIQGAGSGGDGYIQFFSGGSERMRLTSDGNIRYTSNNASNASFDLNYRFSTPDSARIRFSTTSDFNLNEPAQISFWTRASDSQGGGAITERMRITSDGNVGIGRTPSSGFKLDIQGNGGLRILDNDVLRAITITPPVSGSKGVIATASAEGISLQATNASGFVTIETAGSEAMRIFSSTNVHIGATPSSDNSAKLQVSGTTTISGNTGIGTADSVLLNARLNVRNENATGNPTLALFKNISSDSIEDIFRVISWNGSLNTVASIRANGSASFSGSVTGSSIIRSGGTSSQYLMADGSVSTLTNPITGTGDTNTLPKFTGSTTIGNSLFTDNGTNGAFGGANYSVGTGVRTFNISAPLYPGLAFWANNQQTGSIFSYTVTGNLILSADPTNIFADTKIIFQIDNGEKLAIFSNGNVSISNSPTDNSFKLDVSGTGRFTSNLTAASFVRSGGTSAQFLKADGSVDSTTYVSSVTASSPLFSSGGATPNITIQQASGSQNGFLSSTDWTTFNNKQNTLTLTTSGTSGAATLVGSTLNIPNYSADLSGYLPLTGGTLTGGLGGTTATFSSTVSATQFFVNTSGQSRAISTFHPAGAFGSNIWIGGGGANSTLGGGGSALGSTNTSLGVFALEDNTTGYANVAIGYLSLSNNTTGYTNTSVGQFSMWKNTTGYLNSAFGQGSLADNTTGYANSAFGYDSLGHITTGRENVAIGFWSGYFINSGGDNTTSEYSVYLGADTRASANGNTNEIVIGFGGRGQGSNSAIIGNANITKTILRGNVGINTVVPSIYSKLSVAGAISFNNNTDSAVSDNNYGQAFSRRVTVTAGAGVVSIKPALGSEASLILVTGRSGTGVRFSDVVLVIGQGTTAPIVVASRELSGPASRSYTNGGENLRVQLTGGSETYTVFVTGIGGNEMT
jgi:hypothetical protein